MRLLAVHVLRSIMCVAGAVASKTCGFLSTHYSQVLDATGCWREVIKWAAGWVTHVDDVVEWKGFALLRKLCPSDEPPAPLPWHRV